MSENRLTQGNLALNRDKPRVITIEATQRSETQKLRVAAYVRVSSASEDQEHSFAAQMAHCTARVGNTENWTLADIYADEAVTGTSVEKRDDFNRLLKDCRRGLVDKVLTKSIARFARNTKECLTAVRELKALGIGVVFEENGIDTVTMSGEMMTAIFAGAAQGESETISKNMRWSYQHRMSKGTFTPAYLPYGYALVDGKIEIVEEQATIVRRIFDDYLSGISTAEIAVSLKREKILGKNGEINWYATSIRKIISNEKYTGDSLWQKYYTTDLLPYKCVPNKGERTQYYAASTHPAIITKEIFQAVQALKDKRAEKIVTDRTGAESPFQRKLICETCGSLSRRRVIRGIAYWVCRTHFVDSQVCPIAQIPESEIHAAFLRLYYKLKHEGRLILEETLVNLHAIRNKRLLWSAEIIALNQRICEITDQNRMLALMKHQGGNVDSDFFISHSNALAEQLRAAKLEKERFMEAEADDAIPKTRALLELLDDAPQVLDEFDPSWFDELVEKIIVMSGTQLRFRLRNGMELAETIERALR